ncbi:MAG: membrane protein insertion efficiency factor YidD [Thermoguttaceae bacterium]
MKYVLQFLLIVPVRLYQKLISPFFPPQCRFNPSCSEYFILAVKKHGPLRGSCKGIWRILRCNPWNSGGEDWP